MSREDATYSRVSSRYWAHAQDEDWTDDMVILGLYLLTCQARTTEGIYRMPKGYMAEDLPGEWPMERLEQSLSALVSTGFVDYDDKARVVFLPKAMKYQRPDNEKQQIGAIRKLKNLPTTRLWGPFLEAAGTYCEAFHMRLTEAFPMGLGKGDEEGYSKGHGITQLCSSSTQAQLSARRREADAGAPPARAKSGSNSICECGGELCWDGDGTGNKHCPVCGSQVPAPGGLTLPASDAAQTCAVDGAPKPLADCLPPFAGKMPRSSEEGAA